MTYRTASEAAVMLNQRYDGPMKSVHGRGGKDYDYIAWQDSARQLDRVFGIFGWDSRVVSVTSNPAQGVYTAAVEVTARVIDDETGSLISITRGALGRATATPSKDERDAGINVSPDLGAHDTAAASAGSDGFSRACKLLGDAFGLFLYDKPAPAQYAYSAAATKTNGAGTASGGTGEGPRPSDKQSFILKKNGYSADLVKTLDFPQWKGILDALFGHTTPTIAPDMVAASAGVSAPARAATPEPDDIPF